MQKLDPKIDGQTKNIVAENIEKLKDLFPEAFTEGKVDIDALKEIIGEFADDREERYSFTWNGKSKARMLAQTPSAGTLRPCPEESVNWDTTQNLFIEGDNLEALKLLQKSYHKKVKLVYIDPPYNTGKEFIYPDRFQDNLDTYLHYTGQLDDEGFKMSPNVETSGRYHTNWLNMMYPRLRLARNLLRDDGVIFISIDDCEIDNLKKICNEIFGEDNFIGVFVVNSTPNARDYGHIGKMHEYVLFYAKKISETETFLIKEKDKSFKYSDDIGGYNIHPLYNSNEAFTSDNRPNLYYPFYLSPKNKVENHFYEISLEKSADSIEIFPPTSVKGGVQFVWRWGKAKAAEEMNKEILGYKTESGDFRIVQKMRHDAKLIRSIFSDTAFATRRGTAEVEDIFGKKIFSFPKPLELLKKIVSAGVGTNDIVLDVFAGSATTAHSVIQLNAEDSGNRNFIMVQLPEPCDKQSEAFKAGYKTIAEIGKERTRRVIAKTLKDYPSYQGDLGFKVFKLDSTNIKPWEADFDNIERTIDDYITNIKHGRTEHDILYEILLKYGLDLAIPIEERSIDSRKVFVVGMGALVICLANDISLKTAEGIALLKKELQPELMRVVFKDTGFKDDVIKTNAMQILRQNGIDDVKSL